VKTLAVVNNSLERAIKEDSLSESSTKSTTSLSITVCVCVCVENRDCVSAVVEGSAARWLRRRRRPPATGDSRISINPDYKSNSLNTKVTRKGNPRDPPRATAAGRHPSSLRLYPRATAAVRPLSFPVPYVTISPVTAAAAARNIKPDKENALIFPGSRFP